MNAKKADILVRPKPNAGTSKKGTLVSVKTDMLTGLRIYSRNREGFVAPPRSARPTTSARALRSVNPWVETATHAPAFKAIWTSRRPDRKEPSALRTTNAKTPNSTRVLGMRFATTNPTATIDANASEGMSIDRRMEDQRDGFVNRPSLRHHLQDILVKTRTSTIATLPELVVQPDPNPLRVNVFQDM